MNADGSLCPHRPIHLRRLSAGLSLWRPSEPPPSRGAHGEAHLLSGEEAPAHLSQDAPGATDRRGDHGRFGGPDQRRGRLSAPLWGLGHPSLGLFCPQRLPLLAVLRRPMPHDGIKEGGDRPAAGGPGRRTPPDRHAGGKGHTGSNGNTGDQGRRGDRGGKYLRRGHRPPLLDDRWRRGGRPLLQGCEHHGLHGGL